MPPPCCGECLSWPEGETEWHLPGCRQQHFQSLDWRYECDPACEYFVQRRRDCNGWERIGNNFRKAIEGADRYWWVYKLDSQREGGFKQGWYWLPGTEALPQSVVSYAGPDLIVAKERVNRMAEALTGLLAGGE